MKIISQISLSVLSIVFFSSTYAQNYDSNDYGYNTGYNRNQNRPRSDYSGWNMNDENPRNNESTGYPRDSNDPANKNKKYYDGNAPQGFDWGYRESWRDDKKAYFSGETQPQAYRKAHPYGGGGIGYDGDPAYLELKKEYQKLKAENDRTVAENNRIAARDQGQNQEYYSRGGGGRSQKGKASRESRQGGGDWQIPRDYNGDNYLDDPISRQNNQGYNQNNYRYDQNSRQNYRDDQNRQNRY